MTPQNQSAALNPDDATAVMQAILRHAFAQQAAQSEGAAAQHIHFGTIEMRGNAPHAVRMKAGNFQGLTENQAFELAFHEACRPRAPEEGHPVRAFFLFPENVPVRVGPRTLSAPTTLICDHHGTVQVISTEPGRAPAEHTRETLPPADRGVLRYAESLLAGGYSRGH